MIAGRGPTVPGTWYLVQSQISPSSTLYVVPGTLYRYPVGQGQGHVAVALSLHRQNQLQACGPTVLGTM